MKFGILKTLKCLFHNIVTRKVFFFHNCTVAAGGILGRRQILNDEEKSNKQNEDMI